MKVEVDDLALYMNLNPSHMEPRSRPSSQPNFGSCLHTHCSKCSAHQSTEENADRPGDCRGESGRLLCGESPYTGPIVVTCVFFLLMYPQLHESYVTRVCMLGQCVGVGVLVLGSDDVVCVCVRVRMRVVGGGGWDHPPGSRLLSSSDHESGGGNVWGRARQWVCVSTLALHVHDLELTSPI